MNKYCKRKRLTRCETLAKVRDDICRLFYEKRVKDINLWLADYPDIMMFEDKRHKYDLYESKLVFIAYDYSSDREVLLFDEQMRTYDFGPLMTVENLETAYNAIIDILENHENESWVRHYTDDDITEYYKLCEEYRKDPSCSSPCDFYFNYYKPMNGMNPNWEYYKNLELYKEYQDMDGILTRKDFDDSFSGKKNLPFFSDERGNPIYLPRKKIKFALFEIRRKWGSKIRNFVEVAASVIILAACAAIIVYISYSFFKFLFL